MYSISYLLFKYHLHVRRSFILHLMFQSKNQVQKIIVFFLHNLSTHNYLLVSNHNYPCQRGVFFYLIRGAKGDFQIVYICASKRYARRVQTTIFYFILLNEIIRELKRISTPKSFHNFLALGHIL